MVCLVNICYLETNHLILNHYERKPILEVLVDDISNFYVRVNRKRFWKAGENEDKEFEPKSFEIIKRSLRKT